MKWAEQQLGPIPNTPSTDPEHRLHHPHSRQLYLALALQLGDGSDAQVKVMNTPEFNGLEAWR
eukprot:1226104-Amphidinium_carterae.1